MGTSGAVCNMHLVAPNVWPMFDNERATGWKL